MKREDVSPATEHPATGPAAGTSDPSLITGRHAGLHGLIVTDPGRFKTAINMLAKPDELSAISSLINRAFRGTFGPSTIPGLHSKIEAELGGLRGGQLMRASTAASARMSRGASPDMATTLVTILDPLFAPLEGNADRRIAAAASFLASLPPARHRLALEAIPELLDASFPPTPTDAHDAAARRAALRMLESFVTLPADYGALAARRLVAESAIPRLAAIAAPDAKAIAARALAAFVEGPGPAALAAALSEGAAPGEPRRAAEAVEFLARLGHGPRLTAILGDLRAADTRGGGGEGESGAVARAIAAVQDTGGQ